MRHVFKDKNEVAHVWAQQSQSEGRNPTNNIYFRGDRIYSYGHHFCIARMLPSGTVVLTTREYSNTTTAHKQAVRSAVRGRTVVFCRNPDGSARENYEDTRRTISRLLDEAQNKPRIRKLTRDNLRLQALHEAERFNTYLAALPDAEKLYTTTIDVVNLEGVTEELRLEIAAARERAAAREAERAAVERENLVKWRTHDPAMEYAHFYNIPDSLRLSKDREEVETTRGARIPVSHAKRLWPLIENVRAVGKPLENRDIRLGHYTLTQIKVDGSIIVGCHDIAYAEIENIARELGLINQGEHA